MTRIRLSNALHSLAHRIESSDCTCRIASFMDGWKARRELELKQMSMPASPDELDLWLRRVIADSEQYKGAA